jgi:hypothetical protein
MLIDLLKNGREFKKSKKNLRYPGVDLPKFKTREYE